MLRLREDEHALRDAEQLAGFEAAPTPGGRVHRLWRLFATCEGQLNAPHDTRFIREAIDLLDLPGDIDCVVVASLAQEDSTHENPLGAAARVSAASLRILDDAPRAEVEILALWLADIVLAQRLRWQAPLPLLATTIMHPSLRAISFGNGAADVSSGAGSIHAEGFVTLSNDRRE